MGNVRLKMFFIFNILLGLTSCVGIDSPTLVTNIGNSSYSIKAGQEIILLSPKVTFKFTSATNTKKPANFAYQNEIGQLVHRIVKDELRIKGFEIVKLPSSEESNTVENIILRSNRLVRNNLKAEEAANLLVEVCGTISGRVIYIHNLRVKFGNEEEMTMRGIPPLAFSFVPEVKTSTSALRAVIRDCQTGEILWRNEILFRGVPKPPNSKSSARKNTMQDVEDGEDDEVIEVSVRKGPKFVDAIKSIHSNLMVRGK